MDIYKLLNGYQGREFNRAQKLALFYDEQNKVYILYPPFAEQVSLFQSYNQQLMDFISGKGINGEGITKGKDNLKKDIATMGNTICTRVAAYASKIGDIELQTAIYHRSSQIKRLKDGDVLGFTNYLVLIVTPLLAEEQFQPYAVTKEMLDKITATAQEFTGKIGKASIEKNKSTYASKTINDLLKKIAGTVVQFNWLINFFEEKYPAFAEGYYKAAAIDNTGIHHSGIRGVVKNSATGAPIEGATITLKIKKSTKTTDTDLEGAYEIIKVQRGKCKLTITAPGCDSQEMIITILRGKILELNFEMQAKTLSLTATA